MRAVISQIQQDNNGNIKLQHIFFFYIDIFWFNGSLLCSVILLQENYENSSGIYDIKNIYIIYVKIKHYTTII